MPHSPRPGKEGDSPFQDALRSIPEENVPPAPLSTPGPQFAVRVELIGRVTDPGRDRPVQRVARLGAVDDDDLHRAMALHQHLVAHSVSTLSLPAAFLRLPDI